MTRISPTARRKLRTALLMSGGKYRLVVEAGTALLAARLSGLLPFKVVARRMGGLTAPDTLPPASSPQLSFDEAVIVDEIRWSMGAVAPWLPFRTLCLQQAIAARVMLRRRGIASVLHLGVGDPTGAKLEAHAWLEAGGMKVTGYPVDPALAEVGRFI